MYNGISPGRVIVQGYQAGTEMLKTKRLANSTIFP